MCLTPSPFPSLSAYPYTSPYTPPTYYLYYINIAIHILLYVS